MSYKEREDAAIREENLKALKKFFERYERINEVLNTSEPIDRCGKEYNSSGKLKIKKMVGQLKDDFLQQANTLGLNSNCINAIYEFFSSKASYVRSERFKDWVLAHEIYQVVFTGKNSVLSAEFRSDIVSNPLDEMIGRVWRVDGLNKTMYEYVANCNSILESLPIQEKADDNKVVLYGENSELSRDIFDKFPEDLSNVARTNIISVAGKTFIKVIDTKGLALNMELNNLPNGRIMASYLIPNIYDADKVNSLPGIHRRENPKAATGQMIISKEQLNDKLFNLIREVPTDMTNQMSDLEEEPIAKSYKEMHNPRPEIHPIYFTDFMEHDIDSKFKEEMIKMLAGGKERLSSNIENLRGKFSKVKDKLKEIGIKQLQKDVQLKDEGGKNDDRGNC